jgi:hypothetical protein
MSDVLFGYDSMSAILLLEVKCSAWYLVGFDSLADILLLELKFRPEISEIILSSEIYQLNDWGNTVIGLIPPRISIF